jgi:hypothetical protein
MIAPPNLTQFYAIILPDYYTILNDCFIKAISLVLFVAKCLNELHGALRLGLTF